MDTTFTVVVGVEHVNDEVMVAEFLERQLRALPPVTTVRVYVGEPTDDWGMFRPGLTS